MRVTLRMLVVAALVYMFSMPVVLPAAENVIKLKFADSFPVGHTSYKVNVFFKERVEELSKGKIFVEYYPAEQIGKLKDLLRLCGSGIIDIAYITPSFYAGSIPLNTVSILPFWTSSSHGSYVYGRLLFESQDIINEFVRYGVRPLWGYCGSQYDIGTTKKQVKKPADVKGLRLRTAGGLFDKIAVKYGIAPVTIASPEIYEALQRGIVDGVITNYTAVKGYKLTDLEKYNTIGLRMGGFPQAYTINEKKWKSLPKDVKDVLLQAGKEAGKQGGASYDKVQEESVAEFTKMGMIITDLSGVEETKAWQEPIKDVADEWAKDLEGKGLPARLVLKKFNDICAEYK